MDITKENTVYCDALKVELATTDTNTGYNPNDCMYTNSTLNQEENMLKCKYEL